MANEILCYACGNQIEADWAKCPHCGCMVLPQKKTLVEGLHVEAILPPEHVLQENPNIEKCIERQLVENLACRIADNWVNKDVAWKFTLRRHWRGSQFGEKVYASRASAEPIIIEQIPVVYMKLTLLERIKRAWQCLRQTSVLK